MASIKPSKHGFFEGRHDALTLNTWLFQIETYCKLVVIQNLRVMLKKNGKFSLADILLKVNEKLVVHDTRISTSS